LAPAIGDNVLIKTVLVIAAPLNKVICCDCWMCCLAVCQ
jgi:hypothetical protein